MIREEGRFATKIHW